MVQKDSARPAKPRGRPRSFDPDQALGQARGAFWRGGYAATSLDDLSAATGLNRPSLYGAFGDKRAIYLAALRRTREEMLTSQARALANPAPLRETLQALFAGASAIYVVGDGEGQRGCFVISTAVTESLADAEVRGLLADTFARMDAAFAARFEASRAELAPGVDPMALGAIATGLLHSLAIRARSGADEATLRSIWTAGIDLICG